MLYGSKRGFALIVSAKIAVFIAIVAIVGILVLQHATPSVDNTIGAQSSGTPEATGSVNSISPSTSRINAMVGDTVALSVSVLGRQDVRDQNLADDADISWSASAGELDVSEDGTSASFSVPADPGTYTVTATAGSECIGNADDCSATFTITARRQGEPIADGSVPQNPTGNIPTVLSGPEGAQYEVFTPEEGGTFASDDFSVLAKPGVIPNGEFVGVHMADTGDASNAGMSHHRYVLSGNQYTISVIDAGRDAVSSYRLNATVAICIPMPVQLRSRISDVNLLVKNADGTLTALSSSTKVGTALTVCGNTSLLPATVAAGVPGTPPPLLEPEPTAIPPATGGTAPSSTNAFAWALLVGVVLVAIGVMTIASRRQSVRSRKL